MIVPTSTKVGYRRDSSHGPDSPAGGSGPFSCAAPGETVTPGRPPIDGLLTVLVLLATTATAIPQETPPSTTRQVSPRLLASLPRLRVHRSLLNRAKRRLDENDSVAGLRLLQAILDGPVDSFLQSGNQIQSARRTAWEYIRNHPAAGHRRYAELYDATAAALLRRANLVQGAERLERLREVARRFRFTRAGFQALNRLATTWLDQGCPGLAARGFLKILDEPAHHLRVTPLIRRKAALAIRLSSPAWPARGPTRSSVVLPRDIPEAEARAASRPTTDWLLPLGSAHHHAIRTTSQPRLVAAWKTSLVNAPELSPLVRWFNQRWTDSRSPAATALFPIIAGGQIVVRDQRGLRGLSLKTGTTLWHYLSPCTWQQRQQAFQRLLPVVRGGPDRVSLSLGGNPRFGMITSDGRQVFAVQLAWQPSPSRTPRPANPSARSWPSQLVAVTIPAEAPTGGAGPPALKPSWVFPIHQRPGSDTESLLDDPRFSNRIHGDPGIGRPGRRTPAGAG